MIRTERLDLVPATSALLRAALEGDAALADALGATLAASWPPEFYDADTLRFALTQAEGEAEPGWGTHIFVIRDARQAVGFGGFYGLPDDEGSVAIGYSVVSGMQGRGYATEAAGGLVARAFEDPRVVRVTGDTLADRGPSIRVLEKLAFELDGEADSSGVLHYVCQRPAEKVRLWQGEGG